MLARYLFCTHTAAFGVTQVLRRLTGQTRAAAAGKVAELLREPVKNREAPKASRGERSSRPFVVVVGRPLERSSLRLLLGCSNSSLCTAERLNAFDSAAGTEKTRGVPEDWWAPQWGDLSSAAHTQRDEFLVGRHDRPPASSLRL